MLLPFSAIPRTSEVEDDLPSKTVKPRTGPGRAMPMPVIHFSESEASIPSKKISNDQELIQSDPISCPQNQKGNN